MNSFKYIIKKNADITLLELSITISLTFSVATFVDVHFATKPSNRQVEIPRTPGYLIFKALLAFLLGSFWFSIKSMTHLSSVESIIMQAIFDSLFFKKYRRAYQYTSMLNVIPTKNLLGGESVLRVRKIFFLSAFRV